MSPLLSTESHEIVREHYQTDFCMLNSYIVCKWGLIRLCDVKMSTMSIIITIMTLQCYHVALFARYQTQVHVGIAN